MSLYKCEKEEQFVQCIIALEFHMLYESNMLVAVSFYYYSIVFLSVCGMK